MTPRSTRALVAAAVLATIGAAANAQRIVFAVDGVLQEPGAFIAPVDGATYQIDVVLDATDYAGDFFAWHQYGFNISFQTSGAPIDPAQISGDLGESDFLETAETTGQAALGNAWTGGRRPGAFPGSTSNNGGTRFGSFLGNVVTNTGISTPSGPGFSIQGRQQSGAAPENNSLVNTDLVYEVYRFNYTYQTANGAFELGIEDVVLNLYPNANSLFNEFVDPTATGSIVFAIPAPATLAGIAAVFPMIARRRR